LKQATPPRDAAKQGYIRKATIDSAYCRRNSNPAEGPTGEKADSGNSEPVVWDDNRQRAVSLVSVSDGMTPSEPATDYGRFASIKGGRAVIGLAPAQTSMTAR
jgi:hypothetical protein